MYRDDIVISFRWSGKIRTRLKQQNLSPPQSTAIRRLRSLHLLNLIHPGVNQYAGAMLPGKAFKVNTSQVSMG